jgi:DNA polymerase-3 subunit delta'
MSFKDIAGQHAVKRLLLNSLQKDQLSHTYIFSGPQGTGRKRMAVELAKALFCENSMGDACNQCSECRKVENSNHPFVQMIEPEGSKLKIDQMHEIKRSFTFRTQSSRTRVYIILEAEQMTIPAANSLLNFLEEPNARLLAILITENQEAILPTIRSRAQCLTFTPMPRDQMAQTLLAEGEPEILVRPAIHLVAGLIKARELIHANWFAEMRIVMLQLAKEASTQFPISSITLQNKICKTDLSDHVSTLLDLFILWYKDMVKLHVQRTNHLVFIDQIDWMQTLSSKKSTSHWVHMMGQAIEAHKRLRFNANTQLVIENMLLELQGG